MNRSLLLDPVERFPKDVPIRPRFENTVSLAFLAHQTNCLSVKRKSKQIPKVVRSNSVCLAELIITIYPRPCVNDAAGMTTLRRS